MNKIWVNPLFSLITTTMYERWYSMTVVKKGNYEWFKETITIDEGKERLRVHNRYGWIF